MWWPAGGPACSIGSAEQAWSIRRKWQSGTVAVARALPHTLDHRPTPLDFTAAYRPLVRYAALCLLIYVALGGLPTSGPRRLSSWSLPSTSAHPGRSVALPHRDQRQRASARARAGSLGGRERRSRSAASPPLGARLRDELSRGTARGATGFAPNQGLLRSVRVCPAINRLGIRQTVKFRGPARGSVVETAAAIVAAPAPAVACDSARRVGGNAARQNQHP